MDRFSRFVAAIDTPGGQILVCFVMIVTGFLFSRFGVEKGSELIVLFAGVMAGAMRGKGAVNHDWGSPQEGPVIRPAIQPADYLKDESK